MKLYKVTLCLVAAASLTAGTLAQTKYKHSRALIIGINQYPNVSNAPTLDYSESDADKVYSTLTKLYTFEPGDVKILKGPQAKASDITDALKETLKGLGREDAVLIYFSGHGVSIDDVPYWLAQNSNLDLSSPSKTKLRDTAVNVKAQIIDEITEANIGHFLIVSDSCQSGAIGSLPVIGDIPAGVPLVEIDDVTIARNLAMAAGEILASTGSRNKSFQSDQYRSGRFTKHLVDCLEEYASQNRVFRAFHLYGDVKEKVERDTQGTQKPLYRIMPKREGNYMFFARNAASRTGLAGSIPNGEGAGSPANPVHSGKKGVREYVYVSPGAMSDAEISELESGIQLWRLGFEAKAGPILNKFKDRSARARALLADTLDDYEATLNAAFRLYLRSAAEGDPYAGGNLSWMYSTGKGVTKDLDQAKMWADAVVKRLEDSPGDDWAAVVLGDMYSGGFGVSEDPAKYRSLMEKVAKVDNFFGVIRLIQIMQNGTSGPKDEAGAFALAKNYVERTGSPECAHYLQQMYFEGKGTTQSYDLAFKYAKMAVDGGNKSGTWDLAYFYYYPRGTTRNLSEAKKWANVSVEIGNPDAKGLLADICYQLGEYSEVARIGQELGDNCPVRFWNGVALSRLADLYDNGQGGLAKDANRAKRLRELAALKGYKGN